MNVNELPHYKCHKVVRAAKITAVAAEFQDGHCELSFDSSGEKWLAVGDGFYEKHEPRPGKYFVVYEDGYQSVSPAAAFEAGYHLVEVGSSSGGVGELCDAIGGLAVFFAHDGSIVNAGTVKAFEHALFEGVTIVTINDNAEKFLLPLICSDIKVGDYLLKTQDGQLRHMARAAFLSTYKPVVQEIDLEAADFSDALMWLKEGKRVCRSGWNAGGQWVVLIHPGNAMYTKGGASAPMQSCFGLKNAQGNMQPGWVPSMGDMLATDWQVYEELVSDIPPHQLRVLEELTQLTDRLDKLTAFFDTAIYQSLDVDERGRLKEQCALMGELQRVLAERVAAF